MQILQIDKEQIPVSMQTFIDGVQYTLTYRYNRTFDYFTVDLGIDSYPDYIPIISGEKLILMKPLFTTLRAPFINTLFIPMDLSGKQDRLNYDNIGIYCFIYVFTRESEGADFE